MSKLLTLPTGRNIEVSHKINPPNRKTAVYLCGWTRNFDDWKNQAEIKDVNFIAINPPGIGKTDKPSYLADSGTHEKADKENYFRTAALDVITVLQNINQIAKHANLGDITLVAHSMGALIAYEYLHIASSMDRFSTCMPRTLTLISPTFDDPRNTAPTNGMFFTPSLVSRMRLTAFEKTANKSGNPLSEEAQKSLMRTFRFFEMLGPVTYLSLLAPSVTRQQFSQFISQCITSDPILTSYTLSQMMQHGKLARVKLENGEVPLPARTLLIGGKYDTFVDIKKAAAVITACAKNQDVSVGLSLLADAGHFPQLERLYSINHLIRSFVLNIGNINMDDPQLST